MIYSSLKIISILLIERDDQKEELPINHVYIVKLLEILIDYHEGLGNTDAIKDFLYDLRKVFPCRHCSGELKKNKNCDMETYLDIIRECKDAEKSQDLLQYQKYGK